MASSLTSPESVEVALNPRAAWLYAAGIALYALIAAIGVALMQWDTMITVATPAFAVAGWMEVAYFRQRERNQLSLLISGLGWLAIAIAFALRGSGVVWQFVRVVSSLLGFLAILGGGWFAIQEANQTLAPPREGSEASASNPSSTTEPRQPPDDPTGSTT